jgi:elongation factor Ts
VTRSGARHGVDDADALKAAAYPGGGTVADKLTNNIATIGENQQLRRMKTVSVSNGVSCPMSTTPPPRPGQDRRARRAGIDAGADVLEPLGKQLAMHIAAAFPLALTKRARRRN